MLILTEPKFSYCVLLQDGIKLQKYYVGAKDLAEL